MIIECCSQERSYSTFYGLIGERFCRLNRVWFDSFEEAFREYYETIHRYETNRLRNIARFFGHLLASDGISWNVFDSVKLTEEDTTSSSRIFLKILFTEITESMGLKTVVERFKDPEVRMSCRGMFPMDNPKDTRFSINYFTSVGLGPVTEEMREHLKVRLPHITQSMICCSMCRPPTRMPRVSSWSNAAQCWRRSLPPPTRTLRTRIRTATTLTPIPLLMTVNQSTTAVLDPPRHTLATGDGTTRAHRPGGIGIEGMPHAHPHAVTGGMSGRPRGIARTTVGMIVTGLATSTLIVLVAVAGIPHHHHHPVAEMILATVSVRGRLPLRRPRPLDRGTVDVGLGLGRTHRRAVVARTMTAGEMRRARGSMTVGERRCLGTGMVAGNW